MAWFHCEVLWPAIFDPKYEPHNSISDPVEQTHNISSQRLLLNCRRSKQWQQETINHFSFSSHSYVLVMLFCHKCVWVTATHKQVRRKPDLPTYVATLVQGMKYHKIFLFGSYLDFICTDILIFKYLQTLLYDWLHKLFCISITWRHAHRRVKR